MSREVELTKETFAFTKVVPVLCYEILIDSGGNKYLGIYVGSLVYTLSHSGKHFVIVVSAFIWVCTV